MAWTETTRPKYERKSERYQSDLTDAEWALLSGLFSGSPRKWPLREIVNAILYMLRSGGQWRMLPKDFPPKSTVYHWFAKWRDDGTLLAANHHLLMLARESVGRDPDRACGKSGRALKFLRVLAQDAADQPGRHVRVVRNQTDATKYEEARALAQQHPDIAAMLPSECPLLVQLIPERPIFGDGSPLIPVNIGDMIQVFIVQYGSHVVADDPELRVVFINVEVQAYCVCDILSHSNHRCIPTETSKDLRIFEL